MAAMANASPATDVAAPVPPTRVRQGVLGFTLALTAIAYLDRVCISTAAPAMRADLGLDDVRMGYVFSAFTLAYALFEVPSGWFADRFGARVTLTRIVVWWSAFTAATGAAAGFVSLIAVRFLFGVGEAGVFPSLTRVYSHWLPVSERGRAFGLVIMAGALGGAATQPLVVYMLEHFHWRQTFVVFGLVGVVWAAAWFWWFRDDPRQHARVNAEEIQVIGREAPMPHEAVPWRRLVRSRSLGALCAMYFLAIYGWYFYITWLPTYLMRARGFDLDQVGWLAALPLLSIAAGVYAGGHCTDLFARRWKVGTARRLPGLIGFPLAAAAVFGALGTESPMAAALLLAAAAGLAAMGISPAWVVTLEIGGRYSGVVSGAMNMFGNLGGALCPVVVGWSLEAWGSWHAPLAVVAVFYVLAALCWLAIDPLRSVDRDARRG